MTRIFSSTGAQRRESLLGLAFIFLTLFLLLPLLKAEIRGEGPLSGQIEGPETLQATMVHHQLTHHQSVARTETEEAR